MKRMLLVTVTIAGLMPAVAHAGGFLADTFVRPFSPHAADELDKAHAKLGNPLDHVGNVAAGVIADSVAPGSGPAVTGALEARDATRK